MIKIILLTFLIATSLSQTLHANIFKWTDSEGKVHYSATPPKNTSEKAENIEDKIKFNIGKTQKTAPNKKHSSDSKTESKKNSSNKESQTKYSEDTSKERVTYCNGLKRNIKTLESSKNINLAEDGKLKPLNTEEIKKRLAKAKSNLTKNCSGL